jgi:rod shape-determining protein MreC
MKRAPGRATSRSDTLLFLLCLLLSVGAIALPTRFGLRLGEGLRDTALVPLLWLQQLAAEGRTSRARFRAVQAERDSMALEAGSLAALRAENDRLRALLALPARTAFSTLPAEVLRQSGPTSERTLLLGVGRGRGARAGEPVIAPEGLVGVLFNVGTRTSLALTWAHPDFRASAVTEDGSVLGIVAPSATTEANETFLEFRGVAYRDTVATGTLVMTSGLGGVYPKGLPIGRVAGVRSEQLGWERVYRLMPLANPGHVAHVLIVHAPAGTEPGQ